MTNPFPKCISKNCPVESKCLRKLDTPISSEADYAKIIMNDSDKCFWFEKMEVIEVVAENSGEYFSMDEGTEIENENADELNV